MTWGAVLLAAAVLLAPGVAEVRARAAEPMEPGAGAQAGATPTDPLAAASCLDIFGVCLKSGMAVAAAAAATAPAAPTGLRELFSRAADLLMLGADPDAAWSDADADQYCRAVARLARRSASSGAALAQAVAELADQCRHDATSAADATAQRASVLIAGPLGVCYLPAFVCLGLVPVVVGLAGDVFSSTML